MSGGNTVKRRLFSRRDRNGGHRDGIDARNLDCHHDDGDRDSRNHRVDADGHNPRAREECHYRAESD